MILSCTHLIYPHTLITKAMEKKTSLSSTSLKGLDIKAKAKARENRRKLRLGGILALSMSGGVLGTTGLLITSITAVIVLTILRRRDADVERTLSGKVSEDAP